MVTLQEITSVTVTSPWSAFEYSTAPFGLGAIINPTYPIFIFQYQTEYTGVGYVVGTNAVALFDQNDTNYDTVPGIYFNLFGLNYWMGGGGTYGPSSCLSNQAGVYGPWWAIANLNTNALDVYCAGLIPNNPFGSNILQILADLVNQNILIIEMADNFAYIIVWTIPISEISTMLKNTTPPSITWTYIQSTLGSNLKTFEMGATIYDYNLIQVGMIYNTLYLWVIPLSVIYGYAKTGTISSSESPITAGTVYTPSSSSISSSTSTEPTGTALPIVIAVPSTNGITTYISVAISYSNGTITVYNFSPINWTVVNSNTFSNFPTVIGYEKGTWNSVFLFPAVGNTESGLHAFLYVIDPKTMTLETTSTPGGFIAIGSEGYAVVASEALSNTTVTFTVYQILLNHTYTFQNVTTKTTATSAIITGTLYDETTNSPVSNATVWFVAVRSYSDKFSDDVILITSGVTNDNGEFTITGPTLPGYSYYGVLYTP